METLFGGTEADQKATFEKLGKTLQNFIFYKTWEHKGSVQGIHFDFGRHSYFRTNEVGEFYHLGDDERVNLILFVQELINNINK